MNTEKATVDIAARKEENILDLLKTEAARNVINEILQDEMKGKPMNGGFFYN